MCASLLHTPQYSRGWAVPARGLAWGLCCKIPHDVTNYHLNMELDAYRNHGWNCGRGLWLTQEKFETLGKTLQGFYHIGEEQSAYWVGWQRLLPTFVLCPCGIPTSSELKNSVWNIQAEWATQWDFVPMSLFEGVGGRGWHGNCLIDTWTLTAFSQHALLNDDGLLESHAIFFFSVSWLTFNSLPWLDHAFQKSVISRGLLLMTLLAGCPAPICNCLCLGLFPLCSVVLGELWPRPGQDQLRTSSHIPSTTPALKQPWKYLLEWMIKNRKVQESVPPFPVIPVDAKALSKQSSKLLSLVWALSGDKTIMFETGLFHLICGQGLTGEPLWGSVRLQNWQQASVRRQLK